MRNTALVRHNMGQIHALGRMRCGGRVQRLRTLGFRRLIGGAHLPCPNLSIGAGEVHLQAMGVPTHLLLNALGMMLLVHKRLT